MNCSEHKGFRVEYICTDNECNNKILCSQCLLSSEKHTLVKYMDFYQFLVDFCQSGTTEYTMEQVSQYVHGTSLEHKLRLFNHKKLAPEDEFYEVYLKKLNTGFEDFSNQLKNIVFDAKHDLVSRYRKQVEESFDKSVLNLPVYQKRGCQLVMNQITKGNSQHANENLKKLHTGHFEVSFIKKSLYDSYYDIREQMEKTINQCEAYLKKLIKQITILSEKSMRDKQQHVLSQFSSNQQKSPALNSFNINKEVIDQKRTHIQVRLINEVQQRPASNSPTTQSLQQSSYLNQKLFSPSTALSQIVGKQYSPLDSAKCLTQREDTTKKQQRVDDLSKFYFSPQSNHKAKQEDSSFSSTYYQRMQPIPGVSRPLSSNKCNFLLKDNIFSRERSVSGKGQGSVFNEMIKFNSNKSYEGFTNINTNVDFRISKSKKFEKQDNNKIMVKDSDNSDSSSEDSSKEELEGLSSMTVDDSKRDLIQKTIYRGNSNLLSSKKLKDIPINAINLSSSLFLVTCQNSQQMKTYEIQNNNKITLKGVSQMEHLTNIQRSLTSGLFYQFGSSHTQKGDKVNVIKLQQLSENGVPVEIIEMRDYHKEDLEILIPLSEYTKVSKGSNSKPFDNLNGGRGAINYLQFVGIFEENQGFRTVKLWEMQLKNGNVKSSQICCLNTFQLETEGEKLGFVNIPNAQQFITFTNNRITKVSFQQIQVENSIKYKQLLKKRVFKFDSNTVLSAFSNKSELDKINCCCLVGKDKLLVCTKKAIFYLLQVESLEVISITDYCQRCTLSQKIDIVKCECPFNSDDSDITDQSIVRLITSFSKFENKIYLYNVETENNLMESQFIFNPILFCFYGKANLSSSNLNNKLNNMTLILIEENYPPKSNRSSIAQRGSIFLKSLQAAGAVQTKDNVALKSENTLINFYHPLKEISKQLLKQTSDLVKQVKAHTPKDNQQTSVNQSKEILKKQLSLFQSSPSTTSKNS